MHIRWMAVMVVAAMIGCGLVWAPTADAQPANEVKIYAGEDEKPASEARIMPDDYEVGVNGLTFLRIRSGAAGFTVAERGRTVDTRLTYIISYEDYSPDAVRIVPVRGKPTIYVGKVRLITVYPSDAAVAGAASMQELAETWAAAIAGSLREVVPWARVQTEK
jgi:hypothetical protein